MSGHHSLQRGYSLLEVIAAFAILALGLGLLLGSLSGGMRQMRESAAAGRAALHAQSLLASLGVDIPLQPGQRQGGFEPGHYRWQLTIRPWHDPAFPPPPEASTPGLLELELVITWGEAGPDERWQVRSLRQAVR